MPHYDPATDRYESMTYRRCGRSGVLLPAISLGLWHNFGDDRPLEIQRAILRRAFDLGITHFDLANNYGPPYGSAETNFGSHPAHGLRRPARRADHLDQGGLGHVARPLRRPRLAQVPAGQPGPEPRPAGPRLRRHLLPPPLRPRHPPRGDAWARSTRRAPGQGALRRHLLVLRRAHHARRSRSCVRLGPRCSSTSRRTRCSTAGSRTRLLDVLGEEGVGCIAFSPLAQGLLTERYLHGIPAGSRRDGGSSLSPDMLSEENLARVRALAEIAARRGQKVSQLALAWALRDPRVTSLVIGASSVGPARGERRCPRQPGLHRRGAEGDRRLRRRGQHRPVARSGHQLSGSAAPAGLRACGRAPRQPAPGPR